MSRDTIPNILLLLSTQLTPYTTLLQSGALITTHTGVSLTDFLSALPGFSHEYIDTKVDTIFLDGLPIDDLEKKFSRTSHTLALSAVLPGLAAAIFRRNSIHAPLRSDIKEQEAMGKNIQCTVRLKLFNTIAQDCGTLLLAQGVCMDSAPLLKTFSKRKILLEKIQKIEYDNRVINCTEFMTLLNNNSQIFIQIRGI